MTLRDFNNSYSYKADSSYDDWSVIAPSYEDKKGNK